MSRLRHHQRGAIAIMLIAVLLLTVATTLILRQTKSFQESGRRNSETSDHLELVRKSLVNFAAVNGRLPCPADGSLGTGLAIPNVAAINCGPYAVPANGTVPWVTLGLREADVLDGWGRKISYRVYAGQTGLTVAGGADMSNCDLAPAAPLAPLAPGRQCAVAHTTSGQPGAPIGFLSGAYRPGITVNDATLAAAATQIGFALISHGQTGYGAWTDGGGRITMPAVANVAEYANTQVTGTYSRQLYSDKTIQPTANNHFDDELVYMSIAALINEAGRVPRAWAAAAATPIVGAMPVTNLNNATLALDTSVAPTGLAYNSRVITLPAPFPSPMIISTGIGFVIARNGGGTAIGVCASVGACSAVTAQLAVPEYLSFQLTTLTAEKVSLALLNFAAGESVQVSFRRLGVAVGTPLTVAFPASMVGLVPTVAAPFDEVIVTALGASALYVQTIRFCDAASVC